MKKSLLLTLVLCLFTFNVHAAEQYLGLGMSVPVFTTQHSWDLKGLIPLPDSKNSGFLIAFDAEAKYIWENNFSLMVAIDLGYADSKIDDSKVNVNMSGFGFEVQFGLGGRIVNTEKIDLVLSGVLSMGEYFLNGSCDYNGYNIDLKFKDLRFGIGPNVWINFKLNNTVGLYISMTPIMVLGGITSMEGSYSGNSVTLNGKPKFGDFVFIPKIGATIRID